MPSGYVGDVFSWAPTISSGTHTWTVSVGSLPAGLSLNTSTGAITGTPTAVQTQSFTISAQQGACAGSASAGIATVKIIVLPAGKVGGTIWIDINNNGKREANEPVLPGITVTLTVGTSPPITVTTSGDGSYSIKGLEAGTYTVVATLASSTGLTKSWDSNGTADWKVPVTVASQSSVFADFAAVGKASVAGTVISSTSEVKPSGAKIECTWVGVDGKMGTDDDVVYSTTATASGTYTIPSMPYGEFSCVASDSASGKKSSGADATIKAGTTGKVSIAALKFGKLPATGGTFNRSLNLSIFLFMAGIGLMLTSRRRRERH